MDEQLCASSNLSSPEKKDTFHFERTLARSGYLCVAGVDEAGRGPLAGPVVAGCVVLPADCDFSVFRDSKKLSPVQRQHLFDILHASDAGIGFAVISVEEIDRINILQASLKAMAQAVANLAEKHVVDPDFLLVDGKFTAPVSLPQEALVKGESKSASIAAASIIAKVTRDTLMAAFHEQYPQYNFLKNKGYPTADHRAAIKKHGPCPIHRRTFKGVREYLEQADAGKTVRQRGLW